MVKRRGCHLIFSLDAKASVTREEDAPVSSAALAKLSLGPFLAETMTVDRKETVGGDSSV